MNEATGGTVTTTLSPLFAILVLAIGAGMILWGGLTLMGLDFQWPIRRRRSR